MKSSKFMFENIGVYYINLNRCTYRKKFMEYMFDDLGIKNFYRIEAVDGMEGVLKENVKCNLSLKSVSPTIVATTVSHLKSIKTAYKNNEKYALILEDDVSLFMSKIWQKKLKSMIDNLPYDWEIFVLSSRILENSFGDLYKLKKKENIQVYGAYSYIINERGMSKIMKNNLEFYDLKIKNLNQLEADNYIYSLCTTYCSTVPYTYVYNTSLPSTIHDEHTQNHIKNSVLNIEKFMLNDLKINFIHIPKNAGTSIKELCKKSKQLVYNGHNTDVFNKNLKNQLVIVQDPIERFKSAVYYALQKWSFEPQISYLIKNKINTPEKWVEVWSDETNPHHSHLLQEILNKSHKIGEKTLKYKWTYSPQVNYINEPKYIILLENINLELYSLLNFLKLNSKIEKKNKTFHTNDQLSEKSLKFLKEIYKEDIIMYEKYKNMDVMCRLNFDLF